MKTKSLFLLFLLIIGVAPFALAQTTNTLEQDLMHLEQQRVDAVTRGDLPTLERIFADDLLYTHSNARQETKQQFLESVKSGNIKYEAMKHSDLKVQLFGIRLCCAAKVILKAWQMDSRSLSRFASSQFM